MTKSLILLLILLALPAFSWATITPTVAYASTTASGSSNTVTINCSAFTVVSGSACTAGDQFQIFFKDSSTGGQPPYCYDNNFHTIFPGPQIFSYSVAQWIYSYAAFVSPGTTSISCSAASFLTTSMVVNESSGALGFNLNLTGNTASGTGASASFSVTTDDNGDVVVYGFGTATSNAMTVQAGTTLVTTVNSNPTQLVGTVTSSTPGSVTGGVTMTSSAWQGVAIELRTVAPPTPTWTLVQRTSCRYNPIQGTALYCTAVNGGVNTFPIAATGSNHALVGAVIDTDDHYTDSPEYITNVADCSTLTSGNCATSINTYCWQGQSCWPSALSCRANASNGSSNENSVDCFFALSSIAGATYITITMSGNNPAGSDRIYSVLTETYPSSGIAAIDTIASAFNTTSSTTNCMTTLSLTGTNDIVFQGYGNTAQVAVPQSAYSNLAVINHGSFAITPTSSGTCMSWETAASGAAAGNGLALTIGAAPVQGAAIVGTGGMKGKSGVQ